jgi:hypothetical protein
VDKRTTIDWDLWSSATAAASSTTLAVTTAGSAAGRCPVLPASLGSARTKAVGLATFGKLIWNEPKLKLSEEFKSWSAAMRSGLELCIVSKS